jgi:hypothetical protein
MPIASKSATATDRCSIAAERTTADLCRANNSPRSTCRTAISGRTSSRPVKSSACWKYARAPSQRPNRTVRGTELVRQARFDELRRAGHCGVGLRVPAQAHWQEFSRDALLRTNLPTARIVGAAVGGQTATMSAFINALPVSGALTAKGMLNTIGGMRITALWTFPRRSLVGSARASNPFAHAHEPARCGALSYGESDFHRIPGPG